jgi:hypothetical protein
MAAIGPDFKKGFTDNTPIGNVDVAPTLASIIGVKLPATGQVPGRVLTEAMTGGPASIAFQAHVRRSKPSPAGKITVLMYQEVGDVRYFDQACFVEPRDRRCSQ